MLRASKKWAIYAVAIDICGQYREFQGRKVHICFSSEGIQPSANMFYVLANAYAQQG